MAEINLRAYIKEISGLIERDQLDEAIAHSRHILQIYPKHLDSYRMLGKAYLEAKRFGDAADVFQRVLSAVPGDFVSHIGMAIVREDEGNLDAAIWHMERAFESNPANPAIREEMKRLIGRRDGLEPHKVRLTRGALARQYAQGELYQEAIAELRSALREDPDRPDLQVLLAEMYWRTEQLEESQEICKQILDRLPFCLEANRIMAAILQANDLSDEATEYLRRLAALDPYTAFVESAAIGPETVDANAVRIERSDWLPGQPLPTVESGQPEWVASLGVDLSTQPEAEAAGPASPAEKPSWLDELQQEAGETMQGPPAFEQPPAPEETASAQAAEGEIPEWMREAGWKPATGEAVEGHLSFSDEELAGEPAASQEPEAPETGELAPAEIPDWLQDIAPPEAEPAPAADEGAPASAPDWLKEAGAEEAPQAEEAPTAAAAEEGLFPAGAETPASPERPGVPTWIEDQAPGATSTIIAWLGDKPAEEGEEGAAPAPDFLSGAEESPAGQEEVPSWLSDLAPNEEPAAETPGPVAEQSEPPAETPEPAAETPQAAPSWLAGVAEAASQQEPIREAMPQPEPETPAQEPAPEGEAEAEPALHSDTPEWLRSIAEEEEAPAEPGEVPEWLSSLEGEAPAEPSEPVAEETPAAPAEEAVPDWLAGIGEPESGAAEPAADEAPPPDWLSGITAPEPEPEQPAEAQPEWSYQEKPEAEGAPPPMPAAESTAGPPAPAEQAEVTGGPKAEAPAEPVAAAPEPAAAEELDDEEVFAWLESLAESQEPGAGPSAEAEAAKPEAPPEPTSAAGPPLAEAAPPAEPEAGLEWLEELAAKRGVDAEVEGPAETPMERPAETPAEKPAGAQRAAESDWLKEMAIGPGDETIIAQRPQPAEAPPAVSPEDVTQISPLRDETRPAEEQPAPAEAQPEIPAWLGEAAAVAKEVPPEPPAAKEAVEAAAPPAARQEPAIRAEAEIPPAPAAEPEAQAPISPEAAAETEAQAPISPGAAAEAPSEPPAPSVPALAPEAEEQPALTPPAESIPSEAEPAAEPETPPPPARRYKEPLTDAQQLLQSARQALSAGDAGRALSAYHKLIERKQDLPTVIQDIQHALERYPNLPTMWQALGDAYMKADQLQDAIKAYQRGMEVA